ncbi:rho GTPase-activating protein 15-like [Argiope bruennichi]|uniref:Rho GTPase-activating protein 12 like protein n=1 Tax=Argiope bruennichi TaxID=94029 RepID=A0A8T0F2M9_ARGBR|nr:rho GTPase-activating protein 15-like [Argiope bruennichi]KAF8784538.1 Rho GTPase-activating protein 12 like protein [Argiope bruennichi]
MMSDVYVQVLYDFHYHTEDGDEVKMKAGEELLLLKKSNENWWQVIRDSDNRPFYAPSNYLSIIGLNCKDSFESTDVNSNISCNDSTAGDNQNNIPLKSKCIIEVQKNVNKLSKSVTDNLCIKQVTDALSFKNPLCENEFLDDQRDVDIDQKQVPLTNEMPSKIEYDSENSKLCDNSFLQDSMSPIYVNIPVSFGRLPPSPKPDQKPLRKLTNDWFEYVEEESGRKYYYHSPSGKVTWKPPRRRENMQSTPLNSEPSSPKSNSSLNTVPDPPPKQLKPKLKKLAHSSNESLESQSSPCMFTILPPGWSQESDSSSGAIYYHHDLSKKKWYASADENGRTYFYDEDNSESLWELPDISVSSDFEESKQCQVVENSLESSDNSQIAQDVPIAKSNNESLTSPKLRKKAPKLPVPRQFKTRSLIVPECVNLTGSEDNKGYLPPSFGEGYWPSVQDGHFSITRKGTLNKTKLVEGGKRIRKNWTTSFVVLTDVFLLFYKDIRSAHLATPGIKPELCIDLNGALVEWCPEKSSRKNVFQISTVLGHQLLLQDDNAQTTREWFETIQAAIMNLPSGIEQADAKYSFNRDDGGKKDVKLSRSKSTKHYSTGKNDAESEVGLPAEKKRKIRDKLRQFFVRRPTQESLREKGILQDEPVFGCHLETLCTRENRKVPKFVSTCIEVIEEKELTADGLYRASGNLSQVQKIRMHVNQDDYSCLKEEEDVHVLTGALKMFFREMKEPLFPFNMFEKFMNAIALPDAISKLEALKKLVQKMPEPNYETLKVLLKHLLRVTEYHKQNRMQVQNLAIVFGPTLMWPEHVSANIALDMMHQNRIVEFLLLEFDAIFSSPSSKNN